MELFEALYTRRSIRKYTDAPVSDEAIRELLGAAMIAPSAGNAQPWQFVVINDRTMLTKLSQVHPYAGMVQQAPVSILVCGDLRQEKFAGYWVVDCAAAVQNLLLAAHGLGLGAVWTGLYPQQERIDAVRSIVGLPEQIIPHSLIPVGHPAESSKKVDRFKEERVQYNGWDKKVV
ncbi:nitroreductase family protein [Desulfohalobium retbaense]|uniref:Nitroreductase n=1 Tax=Desulfohalobium retbaense (strain ATCC 49708 / DSM 5692 / JCM 16813 / HR100) TaxID=485915 RepID=C8X1S0_DESRD|nr:nitroreductase family protein [Desulfohalobium retbaense]ACV68492.1 nitroreductase [Desulfohalobium retbaense DSM 5692]